MSINTVSNYPKLLHGIFQGVTARSHRLCVGWIRALNDEFQVDLLLDDS